jgi:hypothetical protein
MKKITTDLRRVKNASREDVSITVQVTVYWQSILKEITKSLRVTRYSLQGAVFIKTGCTFILAIDDMPQGNIECPIWRTDAVSQY